MVTIKITLWDLFQGIQDWINNTLNTDIDIIDVNYSEFYIYPKKIDLYVKEKKGKKVSYKKIDHFFTTDPMQNNLNITLENNVTIEDKLDLEFNLAVERDTNHYRVYNRQDTPLNGSNDYIDCKTRDKAIQLTKLLNRIDKGNSWVWS